MKILKDSVHLCEAIEALKNGYCVVDATTRQGVSLRVIGCFPKAFRHKGVFYQGALVGVKPKFSVKNELRLATGFPFRRYAVIDLEGEDERLLWSILLNDWNKRIQKIWGASDEERKEERDDAEDVGGVGGEQPEKKRREYCGAKLVKEHASFEEAMAALKNGGCVRCRDSESSYCDYYKWLYYTELDNEPKFFVFEDKIPYNSFDNAPPADFRVSKGVVEQFTLNNLAFLIKSFYSKPTF